MPHRLLMPDCLRLVALLAIVVVNVQFMGFPSAEGFLGRPGMGYDEQVTLWLVDGLASFKSFGLFSFMFGVGLGLMIESAARNHTDISRIYRRRLYGLGIFGVLHGLLFFAGDILLAYAALGFILFRFRNWTPRRLVKVGLVLIAANTLVLFLFFALVDFYFPPDTESAFFGVEQINSMLAQRGLAFLVFFPILMLIQGPIALGWFCLGLAAVRTGLIDDFDHRLWKVARRYFLLPGMLASLLAASSWLEETPRQLLSFVLLTAPFTTFGYLGLIAKLAQYQPGFLKPLLRAGRASLSVYLGQSIVLTTLLSPHGFNLWNILSLTEITLLALAVTVMLMGLVTLWDAMFRMGKKGWGPAEWVLREITYRKTT